MSLSSNKPSVPGLTRDHEHATHVLVGDHSQPSAQACLELLRAYEPIVRFTRGELFFPTAVGPYVAQCSLWAEDDADETRCIVPAGGLTLERLCAEAVAHSNQALSLRFVEAPLSLKEYHRWRQVQRERILATSRFTTTGMFGRVVEAGFRASLPFRGSVARGMAAAAEVTYREQLKSDRCPYYGRVARDGGYLCLQYWFFYAMNDWRSTFKGVNDHEADWEMVTVYLAESEDRSPRPAWVAFSSHDHHGDDLRRRWDDPDLRRVGQHPVVFAGAGSHSGAFVPGDYVISVNPPQLRTVIATARRLQRLLAPWREQTGGAAGFGIPFVDYARGDGLSVGPGQQTEWIANLIDDQTPWVLDYRGLWGIDTEDPFGGERAPSGPRYERDGTIRRAWANPLGWVGLLKVAPRGDQLGALLEERIVAVERELIDLDETIARERDELRGIAIETRSLQTHEYARPLVEARRRRMAQLEANLDERIAARAQLADELHAHHDTVRRPLPLESPQAHIKTPHGPRFEKQQRRKRFLHVWAAVSTPLLLALVPVVLIARPLAWVTTIGAAALLFVGMEAFARRRFLSFMASVLLVAAVVVGAVAIVRLGHQYWKYVLAAAFGVAAIALLIGNIGDLRHGWHEGGAMGEDDQ
ncbi:MAG: hypothetical protein ACTHQQ_17875 [Solirubrobacteraceae bacterium]